MALLLNTCCAPCALPILEHLRLLGEKPTIFFCGPNIFPFEEYDKRLEATRVVAKEFQLDLTEDEYDYPEWLKYIKQHLDKPPQEYSENSERCLFCYRYRLKRTAQFAKENLYEQFAATVSVSQFKDVDSINHYGQDLAKQYEVEYRTFSLDPKEAHQLGRELSKKLNVYRQKYCGCEFSLPN